MKKTLFALFALTTFIFAGAVSPILSLRFEDILSNVDGTLPNPTTAIGLRMDLGDGVSSGFDVNTRTIQVENADVIQSDFRIFVQRSFGTVGIGRDYYGNPQFTIGANYGALSNIMINFDYVINQLTVDPASGDDSPFDDQLRMSLDITF